VAGARDAVPHSRETPRVEVYRTGTVVPASDLNLRPSPALWNRGESHTVMTDCEFCAIAAGEGDAHVVFEDAETVAFLDRHPAAEGHVLVATADHYEGISDAPAALYGRLFRTVRTVAPAAAGAVDADGVTVVQSSGATAGQDVFHLHVHVVPRFEDDDVSMAPRRQHLSETQGTAVADAIRDRL
jgi:histidine triad (HIT) family protein